MESTVGNANGLTFSVDKAAEPKAPIIHQKNDQIIKNALQSIKQLNLITYRMR